MNNRLSGAILACLGGLALIIGSPAKAADLDNVLTGQPTTADLIEKLSPKQKTRGLARGISRVPPSVDLPIVNFEFDSARLTPSAREVLDRLAEALLSAELECSRFLIEGHTDSVGTELYNQDLSERRAHSVGDYLAARSVEAGRFKLIGKGENELLDPANGKAAINRRVRVINQDG
ncbi:MAG: OmpA family protein [Geminicoccaceae bacterium]